MNREDELYARIKDDLALGQRDAANTPRTALAGFARLRRLIQDELAGADDGSVFDSGAIAAYNYVLSEWPNEDEAAAPTPAENMPPRPPKCDAVLAYCALPMGHEGTHEYPGAALAAARPTEDKEQSVEEGLDVERLAMALTRVLPGGPMMTRQTARDVAAEYNRLTSASRTRNHE